MSRSVVEIAGRRLSLSNLEKELYPSAGFTKAHALDYYRSMAEVLLPHLQGRALTLKRYPEGVQRDYFFEKRCPAHRPAWVQTAQVRLREAAEPMTVCMVNDLPTLIWVENLASLELHVPLARAAAPWRPDSMVFDLDPGDPAGLLESARVALILRDLLARVGLTGYPKTSGKKGLHLYVPLNRGEVTFEETKVFSRTVAEILQQEYPKLITAKIGKEERRGKVLVNWSQNSATLTMVCVYSLRAEAKPTVSFPLSWKELERAVRSGRAAELRTVAAEAVSKVARNGDLFREVLRREQRLPHL